MVALLAEGVDRNAYQYYHKSRYLSSPSSRRAWIEIISSSVSSSKDSVALLAEGVDRNHPQPIIL